jgi:arylsulfatase A-like enzyme
MIPTGPRESALLNECIAKLIGVFGSGNSAPRTGSKKRFSSGSNPRSNVAAMVWGLLAATSLTPTRADEAGPPSVPSPAATVSSPNSCARVPTPFAGKIGEWRTDSTESWPSPPRPPAGAPNVLIWLIDDAGFGLTSAYGGLVETPNLERLAASGLLYTNFHSTPLCSPSRAALLTGRNAHAVHMGSHGGTAMGFPGYDDFVPPTAATTAKVLREQGYSTIALGKWDHAPFKYQSPVGPFDLWPLGQGFEHFYGFLWHDSDQFHPTLVQDNTVIEEPAGGEDYYLTTDLANRAIGYINTLHSVQPDRPFYLYWATGAVHSPHQSPASWREHYRGRFDMGWDEYRKLVLEHQKAMGLVPSFTEYAPMQAELPPWASLSATEKKLYARQMEAIAAEMSEADSEFGRIVDTLKRNGEFDNTLIIATSDNGASAEGGVEGAFIESARSSGRNVTVAQNMAHYDDWGGPTTMPHYSAAWAVAANTPFRYFKQTAHDGGSHVPLIISWPKGINSTGLRPQYGHLIDLSPTILSAIGVEPPSCVDGVPQQPVDGIALNYSFEDARAPDRRKTQYYELWGNRGVYSDGWKAEVLHKKVAWDIFGTVPFSQDIWELYDISHDPGEVHDLAASRPDKLAELQRIFAEQAKLYQVYPIDDNLAARAISQMRDIQGNRTDYDYPQPGVHAMSDILAPATLGRSYTLTATIVAKASDEGVLVAAGGVEQGYSLYVKGGHVHYDYNAFGLDGFSLTDSSPLSSGPSTVELRWTQEGRAEGTMVLVVNGREADRHHGAQRAPGTGSNELFNIGLDTGAPASSAYRSPFRFTGVIQDVHVTLGPLPNTPR